MDSYSTASLSISHLLQNVPLGLTPDRMAMAGSSMPSEQIVSIKKEAEKLSVNREMDAEVTRLREEIEVLTKVKSSYQLSDTFFKFLLLVLLSRKL